MSDYLICSRCILDNLDYPGITFDSTGVCNICRTYDEIISKTIPSENVSEGKLEEIVGRIKKKGRNKKYDCVIGVSGGVDSTYLALMAKKLGLRPIMVHLDNGWNTELAVYNINNIANNLGFDLYTYVINWEEFRDMQLAYLKASVVDIEALTDHAIISTLYRTARKFGVKYILGGENSFTEGFLPPSWIHNKSDFLNIKSIHKRHGTIKLKTYPHLNYFSWLFYNRILKIRNIHLLNYLNYQLNPAKEIITEELGWRDYGSKHHESVFTRFYQAYILPNKFGIDKRKAHLSTLICSGQLTREQALAEIKLPAYDPQKLEMEKSYVLKKLGLSEGEFEKIMKLPIVEHSSYPSIIFYLKKLSKVKRAILKLTGSK